MEDGKLVHHILKTSVVIIAATVANVSLNIMKKHVIVVNVSEKR